MTLYALTCQECKDDETWPMSFDSAEMLSHFTAEHNRSTGHNRWVIDEQRD
jgi:hypothetical protein